MGCKLVLLICIVLTFSSCKKETIKEKEILDSSLDLNSKKEFLSIDTFYFDPIKNHIKCVYEIDFESIGDQLTEEEFFLTVFNGHWYDFIKVNKESSIDSFKHSNQYPEEYNYIFYVQWEMSPDTSDVLERRTIYTY